MTTPSPFVAKPNYENDRYLKTVGHTSGKVTINSLLASAGHCTNRTHSADGYMLEPTKHHACGNKPCILRDE